MSGASAQGSGASVPDRAVVPSASSPAVSTVPASIPSAGERILSGLEEALEVEALRQRFVGDYQYRFHAYSDHYSIVAMFAQMVAREAVASAMSARSDETGTGSVRQDASAVPTADAQPPNPKD